MLLSIIRLIQTFSRKLRDDFINAFSAQAAFFVVISAFPFLMFLLTLLKYVPITDAALADICMNIFPETINNLLVNIINETKSAASGTLISATVVAALWSSSKGFLAIVRGLNSVYNHKETRNYFVLRFWSALYTVGFAVLIIALLLVFVFGNKLTLFFTQKFPILTEFALIIISLRTVVGFCVLLLFFLLIYIVIPNRKSTLFAELPGALLTSAGWMGFSYLYSFYIDNMSNYSSTYGSLTAVVLCMLWLYACMYIMFVGAEVNFVLSNPVVKDAFHKLFQNKEKKKSKRNRKTADLTSDELNSEKQASFNDNSHSFNQLPHKEEKTKATSGSIQKNTSKNELHTKSKPISNIKHSDR